jgi:hypothetical protein
MRVFAVLFICFVMIGGDATAQFRRHKRRKWPTTEGELLNKLMGCLQTSDTASYYELFPPFDTLWSMVMRNPDKSPETQTELNNLRAHPQTLIEFDPLYNKDIIGGFCRVLSKGEDSGLLWSNTVMARYELKRQAPTSNMIGYDHIAPDRFAGYLFVSDRYNRITFCISVSEIQKIKGQFFGGQLQNILRAKTVDEFHMKEEQERAYFEWLGTHPETPAKDTAVADSAQSDTTGDMADRDPLLLIREEEADEDEDPARQIVVERRYYEGYLDNEISIKMYVRYMKAMPGKAQQFDGLYKLGDTKRYQKLEITKSPEGKWSIEDEGSTGFMELVLKGKTYTGAWINSDENGFDVVITQTGMPKGKMEVLDRILDRGASSWVDETDFEEKVSRKERRRQEREGDAKETKEGETTEDTDKKEESTKHKKKKRKKRTEKSTENE